MALQKYPWRVNSTKRTGKRFDGTPLTSREGIVNGDSMLLGVHVQEELTDGTLTDLVMTGATGIRAILKSARNSSATELIFQNSYNQGDWAANEVLSEGKFTIVLNLNTRTTTDVVEAATYKWTASVSGTSEYYLELLAGGDPGLSAPNYVFENGLAITEATAGALTAAQWDYADNDSLGYSTIYVRLTDSVDPDTKADGYVQADYDGAIETYLDDNEKKDAWVEISWTDSAGNPQTILQQKVTLFEEMDRAPSGVSSVASPTYPTAVAMAGLNRLLPADIGTQNAKTVAQHSAYTVPTGKKFYPTHVIVETIAITGAATAPTVQCGSTASPTNILAAVVASDSLAVGALHVFDVLGVGVIAAGTVIECGIQSAGTSTTHTVDMTVCGLLQDV